MPFEENLPYEERSVFDLTDPSTQNYVFGSGLSMPKNFAKSSQEIVIKGGVDASKIRKIYSTRRVTEEEYKTLKSQNLGGMRFIKTRQRTDDPVLPVILEEVWNRTSDEQQLE